MMRQIREAVKSFLDPPLWVCEGDVIHYKGQSYPIGEKVSFKDFAEFEDFLAHSEEADWSVQVGGAGLPIPGFFPWTSARTISGRGLRRKVA